MSTSQYTLETLQEYDERCRIEAERFGLRLPMVNFHLVQPEEMYDIAARGLPGRYSHYQFGREYERQKGEYDRGRARIYELVVNTDPVHAYLLDGNGLIAQLLVIAHVYGHAAVFENSQYFAPADKNIMARVRSAAERIDGYIGDYGRTRVENFIDSCEALEWQRSFDLLGKPVTAKEPQWEVKKFDELFPDETQERREEFVLEKEAFKVRFPKQPERDILAFVEEHARRLEDWQRDVISIIRTEMEYFIPQVRTGVLNEAMAVYYHQNIVQKLMAEDERFSTDDFLEFQAMNARVLHPHVMVRDQYGGDPDPEWPDEHRIFCTGINPYLTGTVLFAEIKRICEDPTEEEREQWPHWAGQITWDEKRAELTQAYDDTALLSEFLSPTVCEKAKLFMRPRTRAEFDDLRVLKDEFKQVRKTVIEQKTHFSPVIEIVDADYNNRGELYLEHRHNGIGLDYEYTQGTMPHLTSLWGHPVVLKTLAPRETDEPDPEYDLPEVWYRGDPSTEEITRDIEEPK